MRVPKKRATLFRKASQLKTSSSVYGGHAGRYFRSQLLAGAVIAPGAMVLAQPQPEVDGAPSQGAQPPQIEAETPSTPAALPEVPSPPAAPEPSSADAVAKDGSPADGGTQADAPAPTEAVTPLPAEAATPPSIAASAPSSGEPPIPASPLPPLPALIQPQAGSEAIMQAREAWRRRDRQALAAARAAALASGHPLAMWADYWELSSRLADASQAEVEAFYARWRGTYVEDRLRNDWLLVLGLRRDWPGFAADHPRFRMNDDREVTCYAVFTRHLAGEDVRKAARAAWFAQRDADEGCAFMASALMEAKVLSIADVWRKLRLAADAGRLQATRLAAALAGPATSAAVKEILDNPVRFLARRGHASSRDGAELATLALMRMAANDPPAAALALQERWERALPADLAGWAWASAGKQAAIKLLPDAADHYQRARLAAGRYGVEPDWPDDTLAWGVRAALRANGGQGRWQQVVQGVNAMTPPMQKDPTWVYWKARGLQALAQDSQDGEGLREQARQMLFSIAGQLGFYGALAAETLDLRLALPDPPPAISAEEQGAARATPGLIRGLQLAALGLRDEGRREWNYSLRGMADRQLLAAAALACEVHDWQLCINTSERTRAEVDLSQRYPMPYREQIAERARELGLDPHYVLGLIRQETRFMATLRSHAGASGLMQIMPATAHWTARRIGLQFTQDMINDPAVNLRLGTGYLKMVLDAFEGSQALAAAAYNAGPNRPRRWREGPWLDAAAWAENIPIGETRDYVKKVLTNAAIYGALATGGSPALSARLGRLVGPRNAAVPEAGKELP